MFSRFYLRFCLSNIFISVVVVFAKRVDAERLIRAANNDSRTRAYFKWIGTDGWTEQLPDRHNDYLESLDGYIFDFLHL